MEQMPQVLSMEEQALYKKCLERNPGLTEQDFKELRNDAINTKSPRVQKFFEVNGVLMENKPSGEEIKEMNN